VLISGPTGAGVSRIPATSTMAPHRQQRIGHRTKPECSCGNCLRRGQYVGETFDEAWRESLGSNYAKLLAVKDKYDPDVSSSCITEWGANVERDGSRA